MCGFAGFVSLSFSQPERTIRKMSDAIVHRGPDSDGYYLKSFNNKMVALGFRRLSIIDLSSQGSQPYIIGNFVIVFNGEVYNYREIRKTLESHGHIFKSFADTEVVLRSFIQWGKSCVDKFIGMFSFVIFDEIKGEMYFCRDRTGVKPLFYFQKDNHFIFGSELKSIVQHPKFDKKVNAQAVNMYFQYRYVPAPHSIYENTKKLLPGHWLTLDIDTGSAVLEKYWDYFDYFNYSNEKFASDDEYISQGRELFRSAFDYRMIADVPVGVFLSGGYDSSIVAGILAKDLGKTIQTFTVGFKEKEFDESSHARAVAKFLGTDHTEYICSAKDVVDVLKDFPIAFDEPFGDFSAIPSMLLAREVRKSVKVALSADGGDELFAGYKRYQKFLHYHSKLSKLPIFLRNTASGFLRPFDDANNGIENFSRINKIRVALNSSNSVELYKTIIQGMTFDEVNVFLKTNVLDGKNFFDVTGRNKNFSHPLNAILAADYKTFLVDDVLQKVDRSTMFYHLEGREPFLDHRIAEWAARLPIHLKYGALGGKHILKVIGHDLIPKELLDRPKSGFGIPINDWLSGELSKTFEHYTTSDKLESTGLFNVPYVQRFVKAHLKGDARAKERAFVLVAFMMWWEKWIGF
ncbi:MAG: asparagine synthase (glutamine-hydrolyzing) [Cryomorphaceae bacterium]|nr:asparagine synthase (glutamine-hydrolyzing) [Cryomorphaceae bacterium]